MARRVFRGRSRRSRALGKPAGAFAGGTYRDGRAKDWEQIAGEFCWDPWDVVVPNNVATLTLCDENEFALKRRTLLPLNVLTSQYTIERIVGHLEIVWFMSRFDGTSLKNMLVLPIASGIQLIPRTGLTTAAAAVLSPRDTADLESNRWMWLNYANPMFQWHDFSDAVGDDALMGYRTKIDVKTRRRVDGANWQLDFVSVAHANAIDLALREAYRVNLVLRCLLRSYEGR